MTRKMHSTTVYLTRTQARALESLSITTGIPQAKWLRRAVDAMLDVEYERGTIPRPSPADETQEMVSLADVRDMLEDAVRKERKRWELTGPDLPRLRAPLPIDDDEGTPT